MNNLIGISPIKQKMGMQVRRKTHKELDQEDLMRAKSTDSK